MEVSTFNSFAKRAIGTASISVRRSHSRRQRLIGADWSISIRFFGGGYLRDRGTGMSDLVITSRPLLRSILMTVEPFVVFKKEHVRRGLQLLEMIRPRIGPEEFLQVAREVDAFATLNYSKTKRITAVDVERHLRSKGSCAPVTTSLFAQQRDGEMANNGHRSITRRPLETG